MNAPRMTRTDRAQAHLSNWGADSVGERGEALTRMLLAFADEELERAAEVIAVRTTEVGREAGSLG